MPREFIGMVRQGVKWDKEIEVGQCYFMQAPKVNGGKLSPVVVTGINIYVLRNAEPRTMVTVRIMGETGDKNHVCMPADYFVAHVEWELV